MTVRAMWKAVVRIGDVQVPVKLYAAVQDRDVHFRLLHAADHAPVKQRMVNPESDDVVPPDSIRRGYFTPEGDLVMLNEQELAAVRPEPSREIHLVHFLPPEAIDHRWYRRPYYLGPDDAGAQANTKYTALTRALAAAGREGLARWTMRNTAYVGALRLHRGYPMLMALRHADEVIALDSVETPTGAELDERELAMARQLIDMLAAPFEPAQYQDEYRERVLSLIQTKASGGRVAAFRPRAKARSEDLAQALEASLQRERKRA